MNEDLLMERSEVSARLRAQIAAAGVSDAHCDLTDVWPPVRSWLEARVDGPIGALTCECLRLPTQPTDGYPSAPDGFEGGEVFGLEVFRELADGPNVGVALYYSSDEDWLGLVDHGSLRQDHPFLWEAYRRDGEHEAFLQLVEHSVFFAMAWRKPAKLTVIFDTDSGDDVEFRRLPL